MKWTGVITHPAWVFNEGKPLPFAWIRIGRVEHSHVVLLDVVHHCEDLAIWRKACLMAYTLDVVKLDLPSVWPGADFDDWQVVGRALWIVETGDGLPGRAIDDYGRRYHAQNESGIAVAGMMHHGIEPAERAR